MRRIISSLVKLKQAYPKQWLVSKLSCTSNNLGGGQNESSKLSLFDQLMKNRIPGDPSSDSFLTTSKGTKIPAPAKVSLIDRLKDYKMQNMWEPGCQLFVKAHQSQNLQLRWQRFHIKNLLECLGNCYRWHEIEEIWKILGPIKQSAHTLLDDGLANLVLNITAIRKPGVDCLLSNTKLDLNEAYKKHLINGESIDGIFQSGSKVACMIYDENTSTSDKPFFLRVFHDIESCGLSIDHYGSRGFVIGICRAGMWELAARITTLSDGLPFNQPAIPTYESIGEEESKLKPFYEISEIEISEIIRKSNSTTLLNQVMQSRYQGNVGSHNIPNKILLAAMAVQPTWQKSLEVVSDNHLTQIDASLINHAVSIAYKGSASSKVIQGVFDYFMNRVLNPSRFGSNANALPLIVIARGITKSYEIMIQAYSREGNWREALHQLYVSQSQNVPLSIDLHGSVLRALNKANRPVDIINSFLALPAKDENPIGKKSLLKTLSLINAYTDYKRRRVR
ncbi:LysR family transcriptional regulator [Perkinsela sp. CCAP 1560/4]|nr:LysR family transcriptional regulator [Perkinsela sp. CCAP 1560/4]|eukprot:KNH07752.1 LysR family transcriptional regulator [Perkinsela sp. CCAP 1560/4]